MLLFKAIPFTGDRGSLAWLWVLLAVAVVAVAVLLAIKLRRPRQDAPPKTPPEKTGPAAPSAQNEKSE